MIIEFTVPLSKNLMISEENNSDHWAVKRNRKKKRAYILKLFLLSNLKKISLPCKVIVIRISPRKLDYDNLVSFFKPIRDQIADFLIPGLAPGRADGDERISWEYFYEKGNVAEYKITIKIEFL